MHFSTRQYKTIFCTRCKRITEGEEACLQSWATRMCETTCRNVIRRPQTVTLLSRLHERGQNNKWYSSSLGILNARSFVKCCKKKQQHFKDGCVTWGRCCSILIWEDHFSLTKIVPSTTGGTVCRSSVHPASPPSSSHSEDIRLQDSCPCVAVMMVMKRHPPSKCSGLWVTVWSLSMNSRDDR